MKTVTTFHIEIDDFERLLKLSRVTGETKASIIREAIKRELRRRTRFSKREVDRLAQKV